MSFNIISRNHFYAHSPQQYSNTIYTYTTVSTVGQIDPIGAHTAIVFKDSMIIFGGFSNGLPTNDCYEYKFSKKRWKKLECGGDIPESRLHHTAVVHKSTMIVFGGWNGIDYFNDVCVLSLGINRYWKTPHCSGDIPEKRYGHSSVVFKDKMYIYGGKDVNERYSNELYELNLLDYKWTNLSSTTLLPRMFHTCVMWDTSLYVFGGWNDEIESDIIEINFTHKKWQIVKTYGDCAPKRYSHCSAIVKETMISCGGHNGKMLQDMYLFDFFSKEWKEVRPMKNPLPKRSFTSLVVKDGKLYMFGGLNEEKDGAKESNELFEITLCTLPGKDTSKSMRRTVSEHRLYEYKENEFERKRFSNT